MKKLTQARLREVVKYDPETGVFTANDRRLRYRKYGERCGSLNKSEGYRQLPIDGVQYREHRLAFLYMTGEWPTHHVDHINRVKDDNRWCNLRDVPAVLNMQNIAVRSDNTSGYRGVSWNPATGKWAAKCTYRKKRNTLGYFDDKEEANEMVTMFRQLMSILEENDLQR